MAKKKRGASKMGLSVISAVIALIICLTYRYASDSEGDTPAIKTTVGECSCEAHFIDVGQGDCTMFFDGENTVIIDAGPKSRDEETKEYITEYTTSVDYLILTHPDEDHIGGAITFFETLDIKSVIMTDASKDTDTFSKLLSAIEKSDAEVYEAKAGDTYSAGDISLEILAPLDEFSGDYNEYSIVTKISYGNTSAIVSGDAAKKQEKKLVETYSDKLSCNILKLAHHGSSTATSEEYVLAAAPDFAVISCGKDNSYGHPHVETLALLEKYNITYYRTDTEGSIVFVSDGDTVCIKK